jgi:hypothetical protein
MTKKIFHYLVISVGGRVSLLKTSGITTATNQTISKDIPRHEFVELKDRALLILHSKSMKGRRSS